MIDWEKSAELNKCLIGNLKLRFKRFPKSNKLVVAICDNCKKIRLISKDSYRDLCHKCANNTIDHCKKISNSRKNEQKWQGENNPNFNGILTTGELNGMFGKKHSKGTLKLQSEAAQGKYCGKDNPMYGVHLCGELASNWQGGKSFEIYPQKFNNQLKIKIRNKYNNCDYISGLSNYICNILNNKIWELDVHHIDYNKKNINENNLIPLSRSNHTNTQKNRQFWERLFKYSLEFEKDYGVI